jgi:hypothetical protein
MMAGACKCRKSLGGPISWMGYQEVLTVNPLSPGSIPAFLFFCTTARKVEYLSQYKVDRDTAAGESF